MKAQFFIISSVIMIYVIVLTFQYLTGFSDIRLSGVEEHQELSYIKNIKDSFIQTLNTSNISNNGDLNKVAKDIDFTKNFFKQELLKKGIDFDSKFIIFSNGFETGDLSEWDGIGCTGVDFCPEVVNYAYDGSFSLYCDNIEYVYKKLSGMNEVYARVYVNFKTLPLNDQRHYFINFFENGNQILGLGLWYYQGTYRVHAYSDSIGTSWNSTISIGENEWHFFELYWYENGTNSKIKAWHDGFLKIDQIVNSGDKGKLIDEYRFGGVNVGGGGIPDLHVDCAAISSDYVGDKCFPDEQNYFDFTLKTNGMHTETEFPYQEKIVPNPVWFNNFVNNTLAGQPTLFSLNWTDVVDLSGYVFSFDNCTGSFTNDAWVPMTGLNNWSSVIKAISPIVGCTIRWQVYANDTSGKWNTSYIFSLTTTGTPLLIQFVSPTDNNGATVSRNWSYVNVSITDALNTSSFIDWNRSLVGYWSMDSYNSSGVFDNSTWNNFGTFNGVTSSNITTGKYGYGLNFNGVQWGNNYINAGNPSCLNLSSTGTLEAWIYHKIYGSANYDVFIGKDDWPSDRNGYNFMIKSDYKLGGQIANATNENYISGNTVIQNYTWYHVAFVWNSTHMILYVNGKVDNTAPQTLIPKSDVYDLWIGGSPSWGASFFNGTIDEVRVWNRALSPEEINASYNSGLNRLYHNFTNLTNSVYQYYAYAIDTSGNTNKTETRTLTTTTSAYCDNYISTCSNLNQANKVYCLNSNVSSVGTCFNILANNITLNCQGYTINYSMASPGYAVNNTGYNFTKIRNCNIIQNSIGNYNHSIVFVNANNGTIQNNTINVYSLDWGNNAVYLQGSSFNNITNNTMTVYTGANTVVYLIWNSNYNMISNNILNALCGWTAGVGLRQNNHNSVINNIVNSQGSFDSGVYLTSETNSYIINNTFNTTGYAIYIESWYDLTSDFNHTVQNNTQRGKPVYYYFNNNSIIIQNNNNIGQLFIANSTNITIRNVTLDKNGITFGLTTNSTIENSNITTDWNYGFGISFQDLSNNNTIRNNTITTYAYSGFGIDLSDSNSTMIQNNTIKTSDQQADGIHLSYSSLNTIKDNRIQTKYQYSGNNPDISADVIQLTGSYGNTIYNNLFNESSTSKNYFVTGIYSNNWNVTEQLGTRVYSNGSEIGGNYWTNSTGNGYSDTCTDANTDGFCDIPYILNYTSTTNNTDYLPLSSKYAG